MKAGVTTSLVCHVALIAFGLVSLSSPKPMDAGATESLPVSIVPVSELAQMVEGDKKAELSETPTPKPTTKPQTVPDAKTVGDNDADLETDAPTPSPREVKTASTPPPPPPTPKAEAAPPKPTEAPKPQPLVQEKPPEPTPAPKAEAAPKPTQTPPPPDAEAIEAAKPEPKPEEKPAPAQVAEAKPTEAALPDSAPAPMAKPTPEKPAETKVADATPVKKPSDAKQKSDDSAALEDQVAALLNKAKPAGGGAKRTPPAQKASLGGRQTTGAKLTQGEMDALSGQLAGCWNIPAGSDGGEALRVSIRFNLSADGKLDGRPTVDASSGNATFDQSAIRAVQKCDQAGLTLPKDKADTWSEVVVNFDPAEMF